MLKIILLFDLCVILTICNAGVYPNYRYELKLMNEHDRNDWWRTANFYQIYPRSFQDSDGDGVGDLNGITEKLSYLKEIGVTATWLSPIFTSPMADFGYDISNFYEIDSIFGTINDFEKLIERAKELDIKIILDFVPNHSSDECEWFKKSAKREDGYDDFYVWHKGFEDPNNKTNRLPPSNWVSVFRGSAWTWNDDRQEFYLHQFLSKQPDLNYRNPKVHEKMIDVLKFWLGKGVSGFRIDAVPHVYECLQDKDGNFVNEPRNEQVNDPDDYGYLIHTCTTDQPETLDLVYEWRKVMDDYQQANNTEAKVLLAETYSPLDTVMKYYGNDTVKGAHIPFNFLLISWISNNSNAVDYANTINTWLSRMTDNRTANWVVGNHDKNRVGSRLGRDRIDMINMIVMTLPGIAVTYQGEEIGMEDVWISWKDTVDPSACNSNPKIYETLSRDPERTPFQWNDDISAGFSKNETTWLPVGPNYKTCNVMHQRDEDHSHLNIYKQLRELRKEPAFNQNHSAVVQAINDNVLVILRSYNKKYFITLVNINEFSENINLLKIFKNLSKQMHYVIVNDFSHHIIGEKAESVSITLEPYESVVLTSISSLSYYRYLVPLAAMFG